MPADTTVIEEIHHLKTTAQDNLGSKKSISKLDTSDELDWSDDIDRAVLEFEYLVKNPPRQTVVVKLGPKVAQILLKTCNQRNRPLSDSRSARYAKVIKQGDFAETGDTIKFSKRGYLMDGQHRLEACVLAKKAFTTHIFFGMRDKDFDKLDQGAKRTAANILSLENIKHSTLMAAAINLVLQLDAGSNLSGGLVGANAATPHEILMLATGKMKDMANWIGPAKDVSLAYKRCRPAAVAAILFSISRHDPGLARDFAHEWVHGAKISKNKTFEVLNGRLLKISANAGSQVPRPVLIALIIQAFNYWNAGLVPNPPALNWKQGKGWVFPQLEFDREEFRRNKEVADRESMSLPEVTARVQAALSRNMDTDGRVSMSVAQIADESNVTRSTVNYIIGELKRMRKISVLQDGTAGKSTIYRVLEGATQIVGSLA